MCQPHKHIDPRKVKAISESAFAESGLTSVSIPGSVKTIGTTAFALCSKLASVSIPGSVKTIGEGAFGMTALKSVVIPGSVSNIGTAAFLGCTALAEVKINYGVKSIGTQAFTGCTSLKALTIPSSVTTLGDSVFDGCSGIAIRLTNELKTAFPNAFAGITGTPSFIDLKENTIAVTGKLATVKAKKVKKKAQKIAAAKLYTFTEPGIGGHLFAKVSGNKKIAVASNGVITVKKKLKKGTYAVRVKVMATGDLEHRDSGWQIITVKVKVK